jgi:hypothetical protein
MAEVKTEAGKWLLVEYARTPGDPKWHPGLGLDSTIIAIEMQAADSERARLAAIIRENEAEWDTTYSSVQGIRFDRVLALLEPDHE